LRSVCLPLHDADRLHLRLRLAARLAIAHRRADSEAIEAVLDEVAFSGARVEFAISCASIVATKLPELRTERGLWMLNQFATQMAGDEGE
jgi:hypothetical protein